MTDIEFVEEVPGEIPSNSRVHRERMRKFAEALMKKPGKWAIYPYPSTELAARATASRISNGKLATFGSGFEATSRHGTVYVRYQETDRG